MTDRNIPDEHHVVRYVAPSKLRKDEDGNVVGILGVAFKRRDKEQYLSATWLEYFSGAREEQLVKVVKALRHSFGVGKNSGFAIGQVQKIKVQCAKKKQKIRIIHEPEDENKAHVAVRQIPIDDDELLELLAAEEWSELVMNSDVEAGKEPAPDRAAK